MDDGTDFYNTHTWTCESCLAYLKDTMQPPFSYQGPLRGLLEQFLSVHNATVEEKKQFTLGTVTVTDNNDYISYSNSDYSVTMDAIQDKLIKTHGGYLQVRYTESGKVLDYLEDFPDRSLQTVEFGKNLTDVKITRDHTERITALIPLGAKLTETEEDGNETETDTRLDITAVNDGRNYVYDDEAVEEIGWIWTTEIWEDVTLAGKKFCLRSTAVRIILAFIFRRIQGIAMVPLLPVLIAFLPSGIQNQVSDFFSDLYVRSLTICKCVIDFQFAVLLSEPDRRHLCR